MTHQPELHLVDVVCATCGAEHTMRSTAPSLQAELCSHCHPAYTGVQQAAASGSRVERFNRRRSLAQAR